MKKTLYLNLPHWLECESFVVLVEFIAHNLKLDIMIIVQIQSASSGSGKIGFSSSVGSTGSRVTKATSYQRILNKVKEVQALLLSTISKDSFKSELLDAVLLEKAPYINEKQMISNGYHLQFPNLFLSEDNIKIIIDKLRETDKEVDDITKNPWLMYGASKNN